MGTPPLQLGALEELGEPIGPVAAGRDGPHRVDMEEALGRERLGRMAAVAGLADRLRAARRTIVIPDLTRRRPVLIQHPRTRLPRLGTSLRCTLWVL